MYVLFGFLIVMYGLINGDSMGLYFVAAGILSVAEAIYDTFHDEEE